MEEFERCYILKVFKTDDLRIAGQRVVRHLPDFHLSTLMNNEKAEYRTSLNLYQGNRKLAIYGFFNCIWPVL